MWWRPARARSASSSTLVRTPSRVSTEILAEYRLRPVAVLAHPWPHRPHLVGGAGVRRPGHPRLHPPSRPGAAFRPRPGSSRCRSGQQLFRGLTFTEPDDVTELADGMTLRLAGVELVVDHAPGHTPGSVTFRAAPGVMFSGDLLFAGSIGRTDLPGGDYPTILDSLARVCLTLPDDTRCCPGTGRRRPSAPNVPATRSWPAWLRGRRGCRRTPPRPPPMGRPGAAGRDCDWRG